MEVVMLERYFVRPETIDRIRASWIGGPIEEYVQRLSELGYAPRSVFHRVPILMRFGDFAKTHGAAVYKELPDHVDAFVRAWVSERGGNRPTGQARKKLGEEAQNPIQQMLRLVLQGYTGSGRSHRVAPFCDQAPALFSHLREERGLREQSIRLYEHHLRRFEDYLARIGLRDLKDLSPPVLSAFIIERSSLLSESVHVGLCVSLRVFLRYLFRERLLPQDLSRCVESPQSYRLAHIPRSISWEEVGRTLQTVDRRTPTGKRDYAVLLLLVTYGLRATEVAKLTLEDIDWKRDRLLVPERKAGHCTAYPLSAVVGHAIVDYLRNGRPQTTDRHVFFRHLAPRGPMGTAAISARASHYLAKAGIQVRRPGSHTLRHSCVQRLVDTGFPLKTIGDYVGHRSPSSTEIYTKVAIEPLREVALGDGEKVL
jgi:integrase/recombinase XerD